MKVSRRKASCLIIGGAVCALGGGHAMTLPPTARRTIRSFGALAEGQTDDADAIDAAIASGLPLDWEDRTYRVTRRVGLSGPPAAPMDWKANGARLVLDLTSGEHQPAVLHVRLAPGWDHRISGTGVEIDGCFAATIGAYFDQPQTDEKGTFHAQNIQVRRILGRPGMASASGIRIRGGFARVTLVQPRVYDVRMGTGAGIPGRIGVNGVMITRANIAAGEGTPRYIRIINPTIENITSDDPGSTMDMDGVVVFGAMHTEPDRAYDECSIEGGLWRNCWGRDIKLQTGGGHVAGGRFEHFTGPARRIANASIAFQWGLGTVEDVTHLYDGISPAELVSFATGRHGALQPGLYMNSSYEIHGTTAQTICRLYPRRAQFPHVMLRNITGSGAAGYAMTCHLPSSPGTVMLQDLTGIFDEALVQLRPHPDFTPGQLKLLAARCINRGPVRPLLANHLIGQGVNPQVVTRSNRGFFQ